VGALDVALDGIDCSLGSNPLLENSLTQSSTASMEPTEPSVALTVSITQHINGLLTSSISPRPVILHIRPTATNVISFLQACIKPLQQNLDSVHNYRRTIALKLRPQILAALSTPDDVKFGCDICIVAAPGLDEHNVGIDLRARVDVDLRVHVGDTRFDVRANGIAAAAAVDMAAAAAGLASHSVTNRIAHIETLQLTGNMSGAFIYHPLLLNISLANSFMFQHQTPVLFQYH
jgi:hypothetical protein